MPAIATHYLFGQEVYRRLIEKNRKDIIAVIRKYRQDFNIGLQGPDPMFYYNPLHKNEVVEYASRIHDMSGAEFMNDAKAYIKESKDFRALAYALGFVCHYTLDSEAHPTVNRLGKDSKGHIQIETELDREILLREILKRDAKHREEKYLLKYNRKQSKAGYRNPFRKKNELMVLPNFYSSKPSVKPEKIRRYRFARFEKDLEKSIQALYPELSEKQILKSLENFVNYNRLLYSPKGMNISVFKGVELLMGKYEKFSSLALTSRRFKKHVEHAKCIVPIYELSIPIATDLLIEFFDSIRYGTPLSKRFDKPFN